MNKEIKQKWVDALRSGKYTQTDSVLACDYGMCCLGVLLDITGQLEEKPSLHDLELHNPHKDRTILYTNLRTQKNNKNEYSLPDSDWLKNVVGISPAVTIVLTNKNDKGESFNEIADFIEENL